MIKKFLKLPMDCRFKYIYLGSMIFIGITVLITLISVVFMVWPTKILDITNFEVYEAVGGDRSMKSYQIRAGEEIEFEIQFKKYVESSATVTVLLKQVNNGYLYPYPESKTTRMPLGAWHYKSSIPIPRSTPPGKYVIIRHYRYTVNNLRTVDVEVKSNEFEVIPPAPDPLRLIPEGNDISLQNQKILKKLEKKLK